MPPAKSRRRGAERRSERLIEVGDIPEPDVVSDFEHPVRGLDEASRRGPQPDRASRGRLISAG